MCVCVCVCVSGGIKNVSTAFGLSRGLELSFTSQVLFGYVKFGNPKKHARGASGDGEWVVGYSKLPPFASCLEEREGSRFGTEFHCRDSNLPSSPEF